MGEQFVYGILFTALGACLISGGISLFKYLREKISISRRAIELMVRLAENMERLQNIYNSNAAYMESVPKLLSGMEAVTKEQVAQLAELTKAVAAFRDTLFAPGNDYSKTSDENVRRANEEYEIQSLQKRLKIPESQAREMLKDRGVYAELESRWGA